MKEKFMSTHIYAEALKNNKENKNVTNETY